MAAPPIKTPRTCSQCGNNGHNARTCTEHPSSAANTTTPMNVSTTTGFKLFGVRLTAIDDDINNNNNNNNNGCSSSLSPTFSNSPSSMFRKSMSMNNLSQYEHTSTTQMPNDSSSNNAFPNEISPTGYASDDALHASAIRTRERKRGTPWTEDEHKLFLVGLSKIGKGDWRGISRNFVKTRTPTQVASHAQKYFLRRNNINRRRRRSSLFDITTDAVSRCSSENQLLKQDSSTTQLKTISASHQSSTYGTPYPPTLRQISTKNKRSTPILPIPPSSKMACLNLNQSPITSSTSNYSTKEREYEPFLSLKLSQEPSDEESPTFRGFNGSGDSIISVA